MLGAGVAIALAMLMLSFFCVCIAIPLTIYGFGTRVPRRGYIGSLVALALSLLSVWLSSLFWEAVLSGIAPNGDAFRYGELWPIVALVVAEALAVLASAFIAARYALRQRGMTLADAMVWPITFARNRLRAIREGLARVVKFLAFPPR